MKPILAITPEQYQRHQIHSQERDWAETNCYVDVWIEQLHALGLNPIAAMPFSITQDFEGDQWTFFKYQLADIYQLYGIEVQELVIWKPLTAHIEEQVQLGRPVLVELDSMYLPDTAGTAYQREHVKTTVSINQIDLEAKKLGYFHAQGYYHLEGDDFTKIFRLDEEANAGVLAPYAEIAKLGGIQRHSEEKLRRLSADILSKQLHLLPESNPFSRFKTRFETDFEWLKQQNIDIFHQYAFVTFRQFGACFELAAGYLNWLNNTQQASISEAAAGFKQISETTKVYQFQLARAISRNKPLNLGVIDDLASLWAKATAQVCATYR